MNFKHATLEGWPPGVRIEGWRISSRDVFWEVLARAPLRRLLNKYENTTYADFIGASVDLPRMVRSRAEFTEFWFKSVKVSALRRCWLRWAVDHAQTLTRIRGRGNPRDAQHVSYLLDCDLFMTADMRYEQTLQLVAEVAPFTMAKVLLVSREPNDPIVPAISEVLASASRVR